MEAEKTDLGFQKKKTAQNEEESIAISGKPKKQKRRSLNKEEKSSAILLKVMNPMGLPLPKAKILTKGIETSFKGVTDSRGRFFLKRDEALNSRIIVRKSHFEDGVIKAREVENFKKVIPMVLYPKNLSTFTVIDEKGVPVSKTRIFLRPGPRARSIGGRELSCVTREKGLATIRGVVPGHYQVSLDVKKGKLPFKIFSSGKPQRSSILLPDGQVVIQIRSPFIAWVMPEKGKIISGYFRRKVSFFDFGSSARNFLSSIEANLKKSEPRSFVSAFVGKDDFVFFSGFFSHGGWQTLKIPVQQWVSDGTATKRPFVFHNKKFPKAKTISIKTKFVNKLGGLFSEEEIPFFLESLDAQKWGTLSFALKNGISIIVPEGNYRIRELQTGLSSFFEFPKDVLQLFEKKLPFPGKSLEFLFRSKVNLGVFKISFFYTRNKNKIPFLGSFEIQDSTGTLSKAISGETPTKLWLPFDRQLTIKGWGIVSGQHRLLQASLFLKKGESKDVQVLFSSH